MKTKNHSKKFGAVIFIMIIALTFTMSVPDMAYASTSDEKCITMTPKLTEAAYDYVREVYGQRFPELGLKFMYGSDQDKAELQTLADMIIQGLTTDTEKAEAIIDWTLTNIEYDANSSAYPMDTFHTRKGNCMSIAMLTSQLMRLEGIPAVPVDGWIGDMKKLTQTELFDAYAFSGHAWILVYLGSDWVMYDPLWHDTEALKDMQYISENYYFSTIEGIAVSYKGADLDYINDGYGAYYDNGKFMFHSEDGNIPGNHNMYVNNISLPVCIHSENDGWYYVDAPDEAESMAEGEIYSGGRWISYCGMHYNYVNENGVQATGCIRELDGEKVFCGNGGAVYKILCDESDYWIQGYDIAVRKGYEGYIIEPQGMDRYKNDPEYSVEYKLADNSSPAEVSKDGYIKCTDEGYLSIEYEVRRIEDNGLPSGGFINIVVGDGRPEPDYSFKKLPIEECFASIPKAEYICKGKAIKPKVTITRSYKLGNGEFPELIKNKDYKVTYINSDKVGKATVKIEGIGKYEGTIKIPYTIYPKATTLGKLTPKKRSVVVRWTKMATKLTKARITGYEIEVSPKKSFKSYYYEKLKGYTRTSYTFKGLKSGKKYYVRIRTYVKVGKKTYYSNPSKYKIVKIK